MHYVIIGNGVAGINAANTIRNRDEQARISIVSSESDHFFSRTALMYVFCGQLSEQCVEPYERDYYQRMGFERYRKRVTGIDHTSKALTFSDGGTLNYDRLLIASGSVGRMADWPGGNLPEVGHFVTWQDLEWLRNTARGARRAVVVGGGLIGIETVEILLHAGIEVTFLVREEYFWPIALDHAESEIVMAHMRHHGCNLKTQTVMEEILGRDGHVVGARMADGDVIDCDLVVVTIGV
ncbi:MAG: NAD(P)/FAD-dependent oxidoreductase, partial [Candidatus Zixiibacteriota bacterium]